jgi:hypothetical protein
MIPFFQAGYYLPECLPEKVEGGDRCLFTYMLVCPIGEIWS